jgi:hypothetical protein
VISICKTSYSNRRTSGKIKQQDLARLSIFAAQRQMLFAAH